MARCILFAPTRATNSVKDKQIMPRIAGIDIPNDKRIDVALTYIFGIGDKVAKDILKQAKVEPNIRTKDLTSNELKGIQAVIETLPTEGELRKIVRDNIETLKRIQVISRSPSHHGSSCPRPKNQNQRQNQKRQKKDHRCHLQRRHRYIRKPKPKNKAINPWKTPNQKQKLQLPSLQK